MTNSYLVKRQTTAPDVSGETHSHYPGAVLSDWELNDHIKARIDAGEIHYRNLFEKLTDREAKAYRTKATILEGKRRASNGQILDAPFDDYIGLHPKDIIERMDKLRPEDVEKVRQYESGGLNREAIVAYVAPSEREPFQGFADMNVRDILEKMDLLDQVTCNDIIIYEMSHMKRPAIIEYTKEEIPETSPVDGENGDSTKPAPVGAGAPAGD